MAEPRYRRRKEARPQEITDAAFQVFAEKGYAATRIEEVAKRVMAHAQPDVPQQTAVFR